MSFSIIKNIHHYYISKLIFKYLYKLYVNIRKINHEKKFLIELLIYKNYKIIKIIKINLKKIKNKKIKKR